MFKYKILQQMLQQIRSQFGELLQPENNSYKYRQVYEKELNTREIKNMSYTKDTIDDLVYMLKVIYEERGKCRYHHNDEKAHKIETEIIANVMPMLHDDIYKTYIVAEINKILSIEIDDEYFQQYKTIYGYYPIIDKESVTYITDEMFVNINTILSLLKLNQEMDVSDVRRVTDYLFCLYYFKL
jgi:hypothetical protein